MEIITLAESISILSIFKVLIITLLVVYAMFAVLMLIQVGSMTRAVNLKDDYLMKLLSVGHLVFALLVLIISIVVL